MDAKIAKHIDIDINTVDLKGIKAGNEHPEITLPILVEYARLLPWRITMRIEQMLPVQETLPAQISP